MAYENQSELSPTRRSDSSPVPLISRRSLIQRSAALGLTVPAVSAALGHAAFAAPAPTGRGVSARAQSDAKTLVIADDVQGQNWLYLDPGHFYEINPAAAMTVVYESLYFLPDASKLTDFQPLLADGMPQVAADGVTVTIKLRQGVKFHNSGNVMTADDVVFSWKRLGALGDNPAFLYNDYIKDVAAADPNTVKVTLKSANAAFIAIMSANMMGIMDSKVAKQHGADDKTARTGVNDPFTQQWLNKGNSCGTGPFKLTGWDISNEITLDRHPDYWGEAPKIDRIIFRNIREPSAQLQAVQTSEVDMAFAVDPDSVQKVKDDPNLQLLQSPSLAIEYLAMNVTPTVGGPLAKKEVRQAIANAIDYDGIINDLLGGGGVRPATVIPLGLLATEDVKALAYKTDLAKAQQLFDSAGVGDVEVKLTWGSGQATPAGLSRDVLAPKLKSDLERIKGLKIKLVPMDPTQRLSDFRAAKLQFTMSDWSPDYPDVHTYADPFGRPTPNGAAAKRVGYNNPQIGTWLDQGIAEQDPTKRTAIYVNIQKAMIDDVPFICEFQPIYRSPARKVVQGVTPHGVYILQLRYASKTA